MWTWQTLWSPPSAGTPPSPPRQAPGAAADLLLPCCSLCRLPTLPSTAHLGVLLPCLLGCHRGGTGKGVRRRVWSRGRAPECWPLAPSLPVASHVACPLMPCAASTNLAPANLACPPTCLPGPPRARPQDARDFGSDGYSLRVQHKFSRHIKLLICVTLYNEDQETLGKTLLGICEVGIHCGALGACVTCNVPPPSGACASTGGSSWPARLHASVMAHPVAQWWRAGAKTGDWQQSAPTARMMRACLSKPFWPPAHAGPVPQNLEVLYRQYGRDGNKHGLSLTGRLLAMLPACNRCACPGVQKVLACIVKVRRLPQ